MKASSAKKLRQVTLADIPHVEPGTPAGEWLRKYWLAISTAEELYDIPKAVKVLGEELVLFRDLNGRLGLVGLHCPHRGTSLEYGDVEETGIRCPYHGWLFDVSGQCLEQPAEPKDSGCFFARSISSRTLLAGTVLLTTSRLGVDARKVIGVKSRRWL